MHVFQANCTVILDALTSVIFLILLCHAPFTLITVENFFTTSISTNAAFVTVEFWWFFWIIVPKVADTTEITSKINFAFFTCFLWFLYMITVRTFNFHHFMPINFMIFQRVRTLFIILFIMAVSAGIKLFALRTFDITSSSIMFTPLQIDHLNI